MHLDNISVARNAVSLVSKQGRAPLSNDKIQYPKQLFISGEDISCQLGNHHFRHCSQDQSPQTPVPKTTDSSTQIVNISTKALRTGSQNSYCTDDIPWCEPITVSTHGASEAETTPASSACVKMVSVNSETCFTTVNRGITYCGSIRNVARQTIQMIADAAIQTAKHATELGDMTEKNSGLEKEWSEEEISESCADIYPVRQNNRMYSDGSGRFIHRSGDDSLDKKSAVENSQSSSVSLRSVTLTYIDNDDLKIKKDSSGAEIEVGRGRFGQVLLGNITGQDKPVAVKHILKASSLQSKLLEAQILKYLEDSDTVPVLYGILYDGVSEALTLVQEYFGGGFTLFDLLKSPDTLQDKLHWMSLTYQLVTGLEAIHRKDVLLNDIKTDNVLVDVQKLRVKYIDLGHASVGKGRKFKRALPEDDKFAYLAPEVRKGYMSSSSSDVYSLCYMCHQMSVVIKAKTLTSIARRGAASKPKDRPSLRQLKTNIGMLLLQC